MTLLRGPKGTIARLDIVRRGAKDVLHFKIVRDKIPLNTVDAAYLITPHHRLHQARQLRGHFGQGST